MINFELHIEYEKFYVEAARRAITFFTLSEMDINSVEMNSIEFNNALEVVFPEHIHNKISELKEPIYKAMFEQLAFQKTFFEKEHYDIFIYNPISCGRVEINMSVFEKLTTLELSLLLTTITKWDKFLKQLEIDPTLNWTNFACREARMTKKIFFDNLYKLLGKRYLVQCGKGIAIDYGRLYE